MLRTITSSMRKRSITPDGRVVSRYAKVHRVPFGEYMPLRGLLHALGAPTDLVPRDAVAGTGPAYLDIPTGSGDVRAAVVISWEVFFGRPCGRRGRARRHVHPQPDQRVELHRHDPAIATGRVVAAARDRERAMGRAGLADRIQRVRVAGRRRLRPHRGQRAEGHHPHDRAEVGPHLVLACSATRRSSSLMLLVFLVSWIVPGRAWLAAAPSSHLQQHGDRAVVDQRHLHLGSEPPGRDRRAGCSQLIDHGLHQWLGVLGPRRVDPTRPAATGGVAVQRELADDQHLAASCRPPTGSSLRSRRR